MAKRDFRTPAQKAKDAEKRRKDAQKAQTAQRKEERKVAATPVTPGGLSPNQQKLLDEQAKKREAVQSEYASRLRTGDVRNDLPSDVRTPEEDLTPERYPNAINYKSQYHDSVNAVHRELSTRVMLYATKSSEQEAKEQALAEGKTYDGPAPTKGIGKVTQARLDAVSHHLSLAKSASDMSFDAHKTGRHADAAFYLSKAADHLHDAINSSNEVSGLNDPTTKAPYAQITPGTSTRLHTVAKTYADEIVNTPRLNSVEKTIIREHVANKDYRPGVISDSYVAPPASGRRPRGERAEPAPARMQKNFDTLPLSGTEEEATADRRAKETRDAEFHEATSKEVLSIQDPKERSAAYEKLMSERTAKGDEDYAASKGAAAVQAGKKATRAYGQVKDSLIQPALTQEELEASSVRYRNRWQEGAISLERSAADTRWKKAVVQPNWEKENPDKTFVGSEADRNPDKWHMKWQVKQHWLGENPTASSEDFEKTEFAHSPERYSVKGFKPEPIQENPDRSVSPEQFRLKDAVRKHWMGVNPGKTARDFEETDFAKKPETYSHPGQNLDNKKGEGRRIPAFTAGTAAPIQFPYTQVMSRIGLPRRDFPTRDEDISAEKNQTEINNLRTAGMPVPVALTMHPDVVAAHAAAGTMTGADRETEVAKLISQADRRRKVKNLGVKEAQESSERVDQALDRPTRGQKKRGATTSGFQKGLSEHELPATATDVEKDVK